MTMSSEFTTTEPNASNVEDSNRYRVWVRWLPVVMIIGSTVVSGLVLQRQIESVLVLQNRSSTPITVEKVTTEDGCDLRREAPLSESELAVNLVIPPYTSKRMILPLHEGECLIVETAKIRYSLDRRILWEIRSSWGSRPWCQWSDTDDTVVGNDVSALRRLISMVGQ